MVSGDLLHSHICFATYSYTAWSCFLTVWTYHERKCQHDATLTHSFAILGIGWTRFDISMRLDSERYGRFLPQIPWKKLKSGLFFGRCLANFPEQSRVCNYKSITDYIITAVKEIALIILHGSASCLLYPDLLFYRYRKQLILALTRVKSHTP